jgi:hypothetical protein
MQEAVRQSIDRGFGGKLTLYSEPGAVEFYVEKLGGLLVDPRFNEIFFDEEAAQKILEMTR